MSYSTPFVVLRRSVDALVSGPGQPVLGVADVAGTARQVLSADELNRWLLRAPRAVADEVWRRLIGRVRAGDATWTVIAAGLALPGLCGARSRLSRGLGDEVADLEAEMLAALVQEMRVLDLEPEAVCGRLVYAARKAGQRYRYRVERSRRRELPDDPGAAEPAASARGPVTVLAEAVQGGVVTVLEAELIARTYLEGQTLGAVAAELGLTYITARRYRQRARTRLANALGEEKTVP